MSQTPMQYYFSQKDSLEDFWARRHNAPRYEERARLFGRPLIVTSNQEDVFAALPLSLSMFSKGPEIDTEPFRMEFVVRDGPIDPGPVPDDLFGINRYTGYGSWLSIQIEAWGHCHMDLSQRYALVTLSSRLAAEPAILSRGLLNTILTNFLIGNNFCMLHCSGLVRDDRLLLLMAPHNTGKSTTALRLIMSGYQLLSDSQVYVSPDHDTLHLFGFPVGKAKLRKDMVPFFPELHPYLKPEQVRDETKYSLDLRTLNPDWSHDAAFVPSRIDLCLLRRGSGTKTTIVPASEEDVWRCVVENSIFYDTDEVWEKGLIQAKRVVDFANSYHLSIGTDAADIVRAVDF